MLDLSDGDWHVFAYFGYKVVLDARQGHLTVEHDGRITWEQLQAIKTLVWGADARAIEVYPADDHIVNNAQVRHLWRLGPNDFCPDLMGRDNAGDSLAARHSIAWDEARTGRRA